MLKVRHTGIRISLKNNAGCSKYTAGAEIYPVKFCKPKPPRVDADITSPILTCTWSGIPKCSATSYIVRWKRTDDESSEWQESHTTERKLEFDLEKRPFSFYKPYECQVAIQVAEDEQSRSQFSESFTFVLSDLFGTKENVILKPPSITFAGFRTLIVKWDKADKATKYAIRCTNAKTGNSDIKYSDEPEKKFDSLEEDTLYTFQVAVSSTNEEKYGVWSRESFPGMPTMQLSIQMGTIWPHTGRQRIYTFHYGITEFIYSINEKIPKKNEPMAQHIRTVDDVFKLLSEKLQLSYENFDDGQLRLSIEVFIEVFCNQLKRTRKRYQNMKPWECGSLFADLRVGRPLEADIALEMVLDSSSTQIEYYQCIDINSKQTSNEGTHLFVVSTKDQNWLKQVGTAEDINEGPTNYHKICSQATLKEFQEDVIKCRNGIDDALLQRKKCQITLLGFKKHKRGVCAVLTYKSEGLLIDLIPILRLPNIPHPCYPAKTMYEYHEPRYLAKRYREAMNCESELKTDLFLLNEEDRFNQLHGAWSLTTSSIDHELLKLLDEDIKYAFRIVKYIMQMYVLEDRQELRENDADFFATTAMHLNDDQLKETFGLKPALPSHLLQILLIQLVVRTYQRDEQSQLRGGTLIFCLFDIFKKIVDSGNGNDVWFDVRKEMEGSTTCGFEIKHISQLRKLVHTLSDPKELVELVQGLLHQDTVPLVNWPLLDGAITIDVDTKSASEIVDHGDALELDDDVISVKDDERYSERERTVFLKQPLDGSWIVCGVVKEIGEGKNPDEPIYLGICKMSEKSYFEKNLESTNTDIRQRPGSQCHNLHDYSWFYPESLRKNIQIDNDSVIEVRWEEFGSKGKVKVTLTCAYGLPAVEGEFETNVANDYVSFMILPHGMKIHYEARQCTREYEDEEEITDDSLRTGFENVKRYLGDESDNLMFDTANAMKIVVLPLKEDIEFKDTSTNVQKFTLGEPSTNRQHKTILLVGRKGVGKSSLIDAICNYIFGTKWDETTRMRLVKKNTLKTEWMTVYTIYSGESNCLPYTLNIIDAPGQNDSKNIEEGQNFVDQISTLVCKSVHLIDAVCFVVNASVDQEEFEKQRYIFDYISPLFEAELHDNLLFIITSANPAQPSVQKAIMASDFKYKKHFVKFDNSVVCVNNGRTKQHNIRIQDTSDDKRPLLKGYWRIGKDRMKLFFGILENLGRKKLKVAMLENHKSLQKDIASLKKEKIIPMLDSLKSLRQEKSSVKKQKEDALVDFRESHYRYVNETRHERLNHNCPSCECYKEVVIRVLKEPITCENNSTEPQPVQDEQFREEHQGAYGLVDLADDVVRFGTFGPIGVLATLATVGNHSERLPEKTEQKQLELQQLEKTKMQMQQRIEQQQTEINKIFNVQISETDNRLHKTQTDLRKLIQLCIDKLEEVRTFPPFAEPTNSNKYIKLLIKEEESNKTSGWEDRVQELKCL